MLTRVTLSLDPEDVALLDRLAAVQDSNRSAQVRLLLGQSRPAIRQTVEMLEAALRSRDELLRVWGEAEIVGLEELLPEVERVQGAVLGAMSRIEGAMATQQETDPRPSNHGGKVPNPPNSGPSK